MKISNKKDLDEAIRLLEQKKLVQHSLLISQYHLTTLSLHPKNLIKGAFTTIKHSTAAKSGIVKTIAGFGISMLTKNLFWGRSPSLIKRMLGNALKIGVTRSAVSNTGKLKAYGMAIYNNLLRRKTDNF